MLYLTCTTITSVDLAHYRVSHTKDWVSVGCGTNASFETCALFVILKREMVAVRVINSLDIFQAKYHFFQVHLHEWSLGNSAHSARGWPANKWSEFDVFWRQKYFHL